MKKMMHFPPLLIVVLAIVVPYLAKAHEYKQGDLVIIHPWARAMPKAARVGSGFMEIRNEGENADKLLAVHSTVTERIEIHNMVMDGGVMKMREVEGGLVIPAKDHAVLQPGGYHLMFFSPGTAFVKGERFQAELIFEKAGRIEVTFVIDEMGAKTSDDDGAYDEGEHAHQHAH